MASRSSFISKLKKLLREDPRSAIALLEVLGPPPGLSPPDSRNSDPAQESDR